MLFKLICTTHLFIGLFVTLYTSVASAIPTAVSLDTREVRIPPDNSCGQMQWSSRECAPLRYPFGRAWDDLCQNDYHNLNIPGIPCPIGTYCENVVLDITMDGILKVVTDIQCVPASKPGVAQVRKHEKDPQVGSSEMKRAATQLGPSTQYHQLYIEDDMLASVSAFVLSEDEGHVVDPDNIIVGKIRGKEIQVCAGEPASAQRSVECFPSGTKQFWFGDIIDFSWGLKSTQSGSLKYVVWPS